MRTFLSEVAQQLYTSYGNDLSSLSLLFPSRRARLFFIDALSTIVDRPMWQPEWLSIDDLMSEVSGLREGDRVRMITELYKVYSECHKEPFDKFYFWGEMLLTDFDTIDKYRIDADMLFRNISDIKEIEADVSYMTPEQLKIISFWSSLGDESDFSLEKRKFLEVWRTLPDIYHKFRQRLTQLGIAYNGMVQREAADRIKSGEFRFDKERRYVIAGFNALTECEKILFKFLSATSHTDFFWDYDNYYTSGREQEAGRFVRDDVVMFPSRFDISHDNMVANKSITTVSAVSNAAQCKYVSTILDELARGGKLDKQTAIVLTDENLLLPLLYSLPKSVGKVNVTMGFPLKQSLAYSFVERLINLQMHRRKRGEVMQFYHIDVSGILMHPYIESAAPTLIRELQADIVGNRRISIDANRLAKNDLLRLIFTPVQGWSEMSQYLSDVITAVARLPYEGDDVHQRTEFMAVIAEHISKLRNSLVDCDVELTEQIYVSLLRRHLQTVRIPFEGEPLEGIQVMGILETRNLDFRNVIILSMNDDNFPGSHIVQSSFVPYNLRSAYGMPTPEHHEGVFAYYFYRLIQRAENIYMLYCAHADDKTTGERSRYIYQLEYETDFPIRKIDVGVDVNLAQTPPIEVAKSGATLSRLMQYVADDDFITLSPTAFFRYVACPLRFYFYSIARLKSEDELAEDVDNPMFGTILHAAVQELYEQVKGEYNPHDKLQALRQSGAVERAVERAINREYLQEDDASIEDYTGNLLLVKSIVTKYIKSGVIPYDMAHSDFAVQATEHPVECEFPFEVQGRELKAHFKGTADRIDTLDDGTVRVVDYKTGSRHLDFNGQDTLFYGSGNDRLSNIVQTLLYSMMLHRTTDRDVEPALYYVRYMHRDDYSPLLSDKQTKVDGIRYSLCGGAFEELVRATLSEMFDATVPFRQCEDAEHTCAYCDYKDICHR